MQRIALLIVVLCCGCSLQKGQLNVDAKLDDRVAVVVKVEIFK